MKETRYYTHRGFHSKDQSIMENTMPAFAKSIEFGYGIELDVQLSKNMKVVVFHDADLSRLHGVDCHINSIHHEMLRSNYNIPTLSDVLELVNGDVPLIIEIKTYDSNTTILCQKTYELIRDYRGNVCVESFDPRVVFWFRKHAPEVCRGQLILPAREYDNKVTGYLISNLHTNLLTRPDFVAIRKDVATTPKVKQFYKKQARRLIGWTLHEEDEDWYDGIIFEYFDPLD